MPSTTVRCFFLCRGISTSNDSNIHFVWQVEILASFASYWYWHFCSQARDICLLVLTRSARLVGALLWGIIRHQDNCPGESNSNECIVGVTGKLYGASHVYRSALWTALHPDEGPNCQHHCPIRLYYIINGGCFGAAALAGHAPLKSPDSWNCFTEDSGNCFVLHFCFSRLSYISWPTIFLNFICPRR